MKDLVVALTLTLLVQALVSATVYTVAVLAPVAQADVGVAASSIGIFTALVYAVAALLAARSLRGTAPFASASTVCCCPAAVSRCARSRIRSR